MSSPFAAVDLVVHKALYEFAPLVAVVGSSRIRFSSRLFDIREHKQSGDESPVIWISSATTDLVSYADTKSHNFTLQYEINIVVPGSRAKDSRQLEWLVDRAISFFIALEDATGDTLASSNPLPLKWGQPRFSSYWEHRFESGVQRSIASLSVPLTGDPVAIKADSIAAPTPIGASLMISNDKSVALMTVRFTEQIDPFYYETGGVNNWRVRVVGAPHNLVDVGSACDGTSVVVVNLRTIIEWDAGLPLLLDYFATPASVVGTVSGLSASAFEAFQIDTVV